jgi:hypothetical protein
MVQLVRLLSLKTARTIHEWMMFIWAFTSVFVGDINLDRFQRWLWSTPPPLQMQMLQDDPALREDIQKLLVVYGTYVDAQHEIMALKRNELVPVV